MPLESRMIDAIHTRLLVRYGARWVNFYAAADQSLVKADWAEELEGISSNAIRHALEHLPDDTPPNAAQFRKLCINRPLPPYRALPAPKANPEVAKAALEKMIELKKHLTGGL